MAELLEGFTPYKKNDAERYTKFRWWSGLTFGDIKEYISNMHVIIVISRVIGDNTYFFAG